MNTLHDTFGWMRGLFSKGVLGFHNFGYDILGEMFEGDSADTHGRKISAQVDGGDEWRV